MDWSQIERLADELDASLQDDDPAALEAILDALVSGLAALVSAPPTCIHFDRQGREGYSRWTRRWTNFSGNQSARVEKYLVPRSIPKLKKAIRNAWSKGLTLRAVGSGHSWSNVALTTGVLVDVRRLQGVERSSRQADYVRVLAGTRVKDLNEELDELDLALENMGNFDGQTIAGAISTGTHGSGIAFPAMADQVFAVDVVRADGSLWRVEPVNRILPSPFEIDEAVVDRHVFDDDLFLALRLSLGCLGVIVAYTLRVVPKHYLREDRCLTRWSEVKSVLGREVETNEHYQLLINPYPTESNDGYRCLFTRRNRSEYRSPEATGHPSRGPRYELLKRFQELAVVPRFIQHWYCRAPERIPNNISSALCAVRVDGYVDTSPNVLKFDRGRLYELAVGLEIGVPADQAVPAVDRILEWTSREKGTGKTPSDFPLTAPIALRWVNQTNATLSPQFNGPKCMIGIPLFKGWPNWEKTMETIAIDLQSNFDGILHWGQQLDLIDAQVVRDVWGSNFKRFQNAQEILDPDQRFRSTFTDRIRLYPE